MSTLNPNRIRQLWYVPVLSLAMGALVIQKHFTLDRKAGGPDGRLSLEPAELAALCKDSKTAWMALGQIDYGRKSSEQGNVKFRRSLYFVKALRAGPVITPDAIRSVRPGFGLPPKFQMRVIGNVVRQDVAVNTPVSRENVDMEELK